MLDNKIKPIYITLEQAKKLKEKGFDVVTEYNYSEVYGFIKNINSLKHSDGNNRFASAPEQWQVVEWLRINHGIWIKVDHFITTENTINWDFEIDRVDTDIDERGNYIPLKSFESDRNFISPQEAYSAAISYVLENLI